MQLVIKFSSQIYILTLITSTLLAIVLNNVTIVLNNDTNVTIVLNYVTIVLNNVTEFENLHNCTVVDTSDKHTTLGHHNGVSSSFSKIGLQTTECILKPFSFTKPLQMDGTDSAYDHELQLSFNMKTENIVILDNNHASHRNKRFGLWFV